jgi:4-amino-4-deoxy-L-arabinose transferase-like glycosyltransferase
MRRWSVALGIVALLVLTRAPALAHARAFDDEQVYSVVAREMLQGGKPYRSAVERKPPLLFGVYYVVLRLAGARNWFALHLTAMLWTLATMAALFVTAAQLFDASTGVVAALLYMVFAGWADYRTLALNGELLMNLPIALATCLTLGPERRRWRPELFLAGALVAVGFLLKQPAGIAGLALGLYLLRADYRRARGLDWGDSLTHGALLTLGFTAVLLAAGALLAHAGILREAIYWSILDHRNPIGPGTRHFWEAAGSSSGFFLLATLPLCLGAWLSMGKAGSGVWQQRRSERAALILLLAVSVLGVSASGQFLYHYYLQLLPPLVLLAAPLWAAPRQMGPGPRPLPRPAIRWLWVSLCALTFFVVDIVGFAKHRAESASGSWVRAHSQPADRLFVWGQGDRQTGMYLDADRRPAARYIFSSPLTGHVFGGYPTAWGQRYENSRVVPGAWDTLSKDFDAHPPRYIIDAEAVRPESRYPISRYPILREYLTRNYRWAVTTADGVVYQRQAEGERADGRTGGRADGRTRRWHSALGTPALRHLGTPPPRHPGTPLLTRPQGSELREGHRQQEERRRG